MLLATADCPSPITAPGGGEDREHVIVLIHLFPLWTQITTRICRRRGRTIIRAEESWWVPPVESLSQRETGHVFREQCNPVHQSLPLLLNIYSAPMMWQVLYILSGRLERDRWIFIKTWEKKSEKWEEHRKATQKNIWVPGCLGSKYCSLGESISSFVYDLRPNKTPSKEASSRKEAAIIQLTG